MLFKNENSFRQIRKNALETLCSWDLAAKRYTDVYDWALREDL